ncbi:methylated-DNA--protein-cysteine methyltransferase, inducible [Sporosarcina sp. NCCP-2331]|nr:methylated-DNA--protein-cysteine methyltransferase, inducible [Sporosarcina sp. NCCP-2331]GLB55466.1 methylated-DNA--protein-cysteine methyltransferase, inducible [Sporosarcina sp. NCCP-2378]
MVYWTRFEVEDGCVTLAANEKGVCYIGLAEDSEERMKEWLFKQTGVVEMREDTDRLAASAVEIKKYLSGEAQQFDSPIDCIGTPFQLTVWKALRAIPYAKTVTYSEIAEQIGRPAAVRAVASAIGKNPLLLMTPCHRVIAKDGSLSGYRDGPQWKEHLIRLEQNTLGSSY